MYIEPKYSVYPNVGRKHINTGYLCKNSIERHDANSFWSNLKVEYKIYKYENIHYCHSFLPPYGLEPGRTR